MLAFPLLALGVTLGVAHIDGPVAVSSRLNDESARHVEQAHPAQRIVVGVQLRGSDWEPSSVCAAIGAHLSDLNVACEAQSLEVSSAVETQIVWAKEHSRADGVRAVYWVTEAAGTLLLYLLLPEQSDRVYIRELAFDDSLVAVDSLGMIVRSSLESEVGLTDLESVQLNEDKPFERVDDGADEHSEELGDAEVSTAQSYSFWGTALYRAQAFASQLPFRHHAGLQVGYRHTSGITLSLSGAYSPAHESQSQPRVYIQGLGMGAGVGYRWEALRSGWSAGGDVVVNLERIQFRVANDPQYLGKDGAAFRMGLGVSLSGGWTSSIGLGFVAGVGALYHLQNIRLDIETDGEQESILLPQALNPYATLGVTYRF